MKLSCIACRAKKIKCDRGEPCRHCLKAGTQCVPQTRAKVTRRLKKPADNQVLERLRQLESIVSRLEGDGSSPSQSPPPTFSPESRSTPHSTSSIADTLGSDRFLDRLKYAQYAQPPPTEGRLVVKGGRTTYVTGGFWANLTNEIVDLVELTDAQNEDAETETSSTPDDQSDEPDEPATAISPGFVLGFTSDSMTLRMMHPTPDHIIAIWQIYKENIGPINRSIHLPTTEKLVIRAVKDITSLTHSTEALMFSIYYMTILTLSQDEAILRFGLDRQKALDRFRFATEQALARAGFLLSQDITLLQAFHLYIGSLSRDLDDSSVPTMVTLMVNIAQSMGLHRDGEQFNLSPFETEMRRRVWWMARTLDMRASLDHDSQSLTAERWSDTKLPLNILDEDIWPEMTHTPQPRAEFIPMTFSLLRWELAATFLRFGKIASTQGALEESEIQTHEEMLEEVRLRLEDRYLRHCNPDNYQNHPMQWASVMVTRIMLARLWLIIFHPLIRLSFQTGTNLEIREKAFNTALDAIQVNRELEAEVQGTNHGWLLKPILHWHAMVIVLCVLCETPDGQDKAWTIVDASFDAWSGNINYSKSKLWKPLCRLYERAQRIRLTGRMNPSGPAPITPDSTKQASPLDFAHPISFNSPEPAFQFTIGPFDAPNYGQPQMAAPFDTAPGFDMPMEEMMLSQDPIVPDGVPWDWSTWDATYNDTL